jgi:hypothetical protein
MSEDIESSGRSPRPLHNIQNYAGMVAAIGLGAVTLEQILEHKEPLLALLGFACEFVAYAEFRRDADRIRRLRSFRDNTKRRPS